ncbi:VapC toxin family PIN domain ribonuclease [Rhodoferax lacus]|uniref:Ribonuclease VapC n=1 Tax=Rhodoferax lacus TaxID=2184758 RepID=A0A3E1R7X7_9BURK|nr:type II toxin-antitoxin system VapC family toxin [Rhodoferax lacus]RFO95466.1 VapC toxin family PIN domain ribonuclease [Rhodoferax lacus]
MTARYLVDSNILSYFIRGGYAHLHARMGEELARQSVVTSSICRAELRFGQSGLGAQDKRQRMIDLCLLQVPALPWTDAVADTYGPLAQKLRQKGRPIGAMDTLIAAHALAEGLVLVSHNTRHFEDIEGLLLEDWALPQP